MKPLRSILSQTLVVGMIGYLTVVLFFALLNLIGGRPVTYTAEAIGATLFGRTGAPAILAANGIHLLFSLAVAFLATAGVWVIERQPITWFFAFFVLLTAVVVGSVLLGVVASDLAAATSWAGLAAGNVLATVAMGATLWMTHPQLRAIMREAPE